MIKKTFFLVLIYFFAFTNVHAFSPGETLDPGCGPGEKILVNGILEDCYVEMEFLNETNISNSVGFSNVVKNIVTNEVKSIPEGWLLQGNTVLDSSTKFLGTLDTQPLIFKTNNQEVMRLDETGNVYVKNNLGLGVSDPTARLDVNGVIKLNNQIFETTDNSNFGFNSAIASNAGSDNVFLGRDSGFSTGVSSNLNLFGKEAGYSSSLIDNSNFFGYQAGYQANKANNSNFFGYQAGYSTTASTALLGAHNSNFFGYQAGLDSGASYNSNFFGRFAGMNATDAVHSNFFGYGAGNGATLSKESNFFGANAGFNAVGVSGSNFFGVNAGNGAGGASNSNFFGQNSGLGSGSRNSNFFGYGAGANTTVAHNSNFFGSSAGSGAQYAPNSNFFGNAAGNGAQYAANSNFFGFAAGSSAPNARDSIFIGAYSGRNAENSYNSIFLGKNSGDYYNTTSPKGSRNAANSIFIGDYAGFTEADSNLNNTSVFNETTTFANTSILVGHATSTGGFSNSIALGAYATNTAQNQFMIGSTKRPISQIVMVSSSGASCAQNINGLSCSSDERLKDNIQDISDNILEKLQNVSTVTYEWRDKVGEGTREIGFIAQNIQKEFPELVSENADKYLMVNYAQMTPILTKAVNDIVTLADTFKQNLVSWFADASNGIELFIAGTLKAKDQVCVGSTCINEAQLQQIIMQSQNQNQGQSISISPEGSSGIIPQNAPDGNTGNPVDATPVPELPKDATTPVPVVSDPQI